MEVVIAEDGDGHLGEVEELEAVFDGSNLGRRHLSQSIPCQTESEEQKGRITFDECGQWCGAVGRAVASTKRDTRFESSHRLY